MYTEYHYRAGYLLYYSVRAEDLNFFFYEPEFALNESTVAAGLQPPFSCYMITHYGPGGSSRETWFMDHGEWTGEDGPCPVDESRIPPALSWAAE